MFMSCRPPTAPTGGLDAELKEPHKTIREKMREIEEAEARQKAEAEAAAATASAAQAFASLGVESSSSSSSAAPAPAAVAVAALRVPSFPTLELEDHPDDTLLKNDKQTTEQGTEVTFTGTEKGVPLTPFSMHWYSFDQPYNPEDKTGVYPGLGAFDSREAYDRAVDTMVLKINADSSFLETLDPGHTDYLTKPRVHLPCPFPARARPFVMPSFKAIKFRSLYGFTYKSVRKCIARVAEQVHRFGVKGGVGDKVQFRGVDLAQDLVLNGADLLKGVDLGDDNNVLSSNDAAHAILLRSYVRAAANTTGMELEVRSAFPTEGAGGSVLIDATTTNHPQSSASDRMHYASVPAVPAAAAAAAAASSSSAGPGAGAAPADPSSVLFDLPQLERITSPEAFRWRNLCEGDFERAIRDTKLYSRGPRGVECVAIPVDYDPRDRDLLQFLVMSYAHDFRNWYEAHNLVEEMADFRPNPDRPIQCIYVRIDAIMEVARHYIRHFQNGVVVNLRDSFTFVRPHGVGKTWTNRVVTAKDKQFDADIEVYHYVLVLPTQVPLAQPGAFSSTLEEIKGVLKSADESVVARE